MFYLPFSLEAWDTPSFNTVLKQEVCSLDSKLLPLQQGLQYSSYAVGDKLSVTVLEMNEDAANLIVKAGLLYNGIIAGCSCADDPTPTDETNEYCDVLFCINKQTAETTVTLVS
ncbi:MAG: hypothetical protein BMS9Abin19_0590 [Gammaproteobacteria bacterium]|nr:MAG: hypothetical protein BMS9Abin19_0590 [Gammaproteobacteria bacterium]